MITTALRHAAEDYIRPSGLAALALCSGMALMQARAVELDGKTETAPEANLGTDLHGLAQDAVEAWKETRSIGTEWGTIIANACNLAAARGIDGWSVNCLQRSLEFVRDLISKHDIEPDNVLTEHALDMAALGFMRKGTADLVLVVPGKLVIVLDYKFGFVDQGDAEDHDQTQAYAAAAAETFDADEVLVYLVQPRAEKAYRFTGAKYSAATLRANRAWTVAVIRLARGDNPQLTAGYTQCVHCRALHRCPEARRYIMETQEALAALGAPLDADGLGELAGAAKLAEKFADAGKEIAKKALMENRPVTGWKLGTPRAMRTVAQVPAALQRLTAAGYKDMAHAALSLSASKLSSEALAVIADHVTEKLSDPPLTQNKRSGAAA
jgi:hypothetical protein